MMTSLVMVYGNEIMVKGLNVNKASSTFKVITLKVTLTQALSTMHSQRSNCLTVIQQYNTMYPDLSGWDLVYHHL